MSRKGWERGKRLVVQFGGILLLIAADLGIKSIVQSRLRPIGSYPVINNIFAFSYAENTGAAWGVMSDRSALLSAVIVLALIGMCIYMIFTKETRKFWHICISLIFSGGAANLIDRFLHGFVTDYLHVLFIDFPVFNLADCFVVVGCLLMIFCLVLDLVREYRQKKSNTGNEDGET